MSKDTEKKISDKKLENTLNRLNNRDTALYIIEEMSKGKIPDKPVRLEEGDELDTLTRIGYKKKKPN